MTGAAPHPPPPPHPRYMRPCRHWIGPLRAYCGQTPTRYYLPGPRCAEHSPQPITYVADRPRHP